MGSRCVLFGLLAVVAAAAAVLSFAALCDLARLCGFAPVLAWLLPVVIDAGAAAGSLVWLAGPVAAAARGFARALALTLLGLSVAANALGHGLEAFRLAPAWWVVVIVSAVAPAVLGAVVHLAVLVGRTQPHDAGQHTTEHSGGEQRDVEQCDVAESGAAVLELAVRASAAELLDEHGLSHRWATAPPAEHAIPAGRGAPAVEEVRPARVSVDPDGRVVELVALLNAGAAVTAAQAAALYGCSARTGRRLLTRAQQVCTACAVDDAGLVVAGLTAAGGTC